MDDLQQHLDNFDIAPGDTVTVHTFETVQILGGFAAACTSETMTVDAIPADALASGSIAIVPTKPLSGVQLGLDREQFEGWIEQAHADAREEGGHGLLLGYDPLRPERTIDEGQLGLSDDCVFLWDRPRGAGPMFEWSEVAMVSANRGSPTASVFLVDGRSVFLHAAIDWFNRLS
jgi:hypothetical protein